MGARDRFERLRREMRGELESFELRDGPRFYYDRDAVGREVFLFVVACMEAQGDACAPQGVPVPEPPEVVKAIARAKDRRAAIEEVFEGGFMELPYDVEALVERGEFVPVSMVAGHELGDELPDLSEQAAEGDARW